MGVTLPRVGAPAVEWDSQAWVGLLSFNLPAPRNVFSALQEA